MKKVKSKEPVYQRLGDFTSWEILPQLDWTKPLITIQMGNKSYPVRTRSMRYLTFRRSLVCVQCGLIGNIMGLDLQKGVHRPHFNLYARDLAGNDILMTKDHIVPRSKGGKNTLSNMQTMCVQCNGKKGNGDPPTPPSRIRKAKRRPNRCRFVGCKERPGTTLCSKHQGATEAELRVHRVPSAV